MSSQALSKILAWILVSGGPTEQLARVRWPLHVAFREGLEQAGRSGRLDLLGARPATRPSSDFGIEVEGLDQAHNELVKGDLLRPLGSGRSAALVIDPEAAVQVRRELLALEPERVRLYRAIGTRWAALASTARKNRSTAATSPAPTVMSLTPNRAGTAAGEVA